MNTDKDEATVSGYLSLINILIFTEKKRTFEFIEQFEILRN